MVLTVECAPRLTALRAAVVTQGLLTLVFGWVSDRYIMKVAREHAVHAVHTHFCKDEQGVLHTPY